MSTLQAGVPEPQLLVGEILAPGATQSALLLYNVESEPDEAVKAGYPIGC